MLIKINQTKKGFTLIELLVVIAIIGILATIIIVSVSTVRAKARDVQRITQVRQLQNALQLYYEQYGRYPVSAGCGSTAPNSGWCSSIHTESGGHWIKDSGVTNVLAPYLAVEPKDPSQETTGSFPPQSTGANGAGIYYFSAGYGGPGKWYAIVFSLEKFPHPLEQQDGVKACDGTNFHYGNNSNGIITVGASC